MIGELILEKKYWFFVNECDYKIEFYLLEKEGK